METLLLTLSGKSQKLYLNNYKRQFIQDAAKQLPAVLSSPSPLLTYNYYYT